MSQVVFVGQGPNRAAWEYGLAAGRCSAMTRLSLPSGDPKLELPAIGYAEKYCARVAVTGAIGKRLGEFLDLSLHDFFATYKRVNLNARFNGKSGKGDLFDRAEGEATARILIEERPADGATHFVLLGAEVARAFGFKGEFLEVRERNTPHLFFLLFPHPSGLSTWWNEDFNRYRARKRLREFVESANPPKP